MQREVVLSVAEALSSAAFECAQEMLFAYKIIKSMGLPI